MFFAVWGMNEKTSVFFAEIWHIYEVSSVMRAAMPFTCAVFRRFEEKKGQKVEKRAFYFVNLTNIVYICLRNTRKNLSNNKKRTQ